MNALFYNFNRLLMAVINVAVQLLQNESSYMIAIYTAYEERNRTIVILFSANTPFATAKTDIINIHSCLYILFVIISTKLIVNLV
jgi:hypothetical protein